MIDWVCLSSFILRKRERPTDIWEGDQGRQFPRSSNSTSRKLAQDFPKVLLPKTIQDNKGATSAESGRREELLAPQHLFAVSALITINCFIAWRPLNGAANMAFSL